MLGQGSIIAGKYRLERELARGGMGTVWAGRHLALGKAVAVKLTAPAAPRSAQTRGCFEREARAAAKLDSKHVVRVEDSGSDGPTPYLIMELLQGEDLATRLLRERRLPPAEVAALLGQIARGLRCAHDAGLVHCDLKPANIFLATSDGEEVVKILDFGLAIEAGGPSRPGQPGTIMGSPHYMSPEQAHGRAVDHRSDLWSLAVLAFQAVTGALPFPGTRLADVLLKVCSGPVPRPSEIAPDLPEPLDDFFACALRRDPAARYQSVIEMAEAFAALAGLEDPAAVVRSTRNPPRASVIHPVSSRPPAAQPRIKPGSLASMVAVAAALVLSPAVAASIGALGADPAAGLAGSITSSPPGARKLAGGLSWRPAGPRDLALFARARQ